MKAKDILQFYDDYYERYGTTVYLHFNDILNDVLTEKPFTQKREDKIKAFHHLIIDLKKLVEGG